MELKKQLGSIFDVLIGLLLFALIITSFILFQTDLREDPYNIPLIVGLMFIYIPISITQIFQGIIGLVEHPTENKKNFHEKLGRNSKPILLASHITYTTSLAVATALFVWTFTVYNEIIMLTIDEPIFIGVIALYFGGFLWLAIITAELFFIRKGSSALFTIEEKINNLYRKKLSKIQSVSLLIILITATSGILIFEIAEPETCFGGTSTFGTPAYDLPSSHYNTTLDNPSFVNQTILLSFEKALRNMTRLQRMGGFPMDALHDGSKMASDRGFGCPLFPDEFSLQGGTAYIAGIYLDMYEVEPNPIYLNIAKAAADALVAVQDEDTGGFYYDGRRYSNGDGYQPHPRNMKQHTVLDDNVMQGCMSFLLDVYNATGDQKYLDAINAGFECLFELEKPGGGWPQRSNYQDYEYQSYTTLNDDLMEDVVNLMLKAHQMFPGDSRYLTSAERAGQFLIRVQGNGGSAMQTAWAQQYRDDQPAWARKFEPPAMCSRQTAKSIDILISLYLETGNETYLKPIPAAIDWLNASTILYDDDGEEERGWSRLYELGTNVPIYGIADGGEGQNPEYVYPYEDARDGYSWQGDFGANSSIDDWVKLQQLNNNTEDFLDWKNEERDLADLEDDAEEAIDELNDNFFWIDDNIIADSEFVNKARDVIEYLAKAIK